MVKSNMVKTKLPLWSGGSAPCILTLAPDCSEYSAVLFECSAVLLCQVLTAWTTGWAPEPICAL